MTSLDYTVELIFFDGVNQALCFKYDNDSLYSPCNLDAYIYPLSPKAKYRLFTDDKLLVDYVLKHSEIIIYG